MPLIQSTTSIAANAVSTNLIAGQLHEFLARPSAVRLSATGSAAGVNLTFIIGSQVVIQDQALNAQNRIPLVPDDFLAEGGGLAGERIVVTARNTTAGVLNANIRVEIVPVA